ncbi:MAG: ATP-binding protein [Candidatus Thorarchaeota archaeon]
MTTEITILSGKGGTGKTTLSAAFAYLLREKAIFADVDVDAPDLHLIFQPSILDEEKLFISKKVSRDESLCTQCDLCGEKCRFQAITATEIFYHKCEGCRLCTRICPENALSLEQVLTAKLFTSTCRFGDFIHAEMMIGEGNSGRIVSAVRKQAAKIAEEKKHEFLLIDGSPGIGCPVIASITGANLVVLVTEPTLSGIHDIERVLDLTDHFHVPTVVIINKYDINHENTTKIEQYCLENNIPLVGKIPFDIIVPKSINAQKTIFEMPENKISQAVTDIWHNIEKIVKKET